VNNDHAFLPLSLYPSAYQVGEPWEDAGHDGKIPEKSYDAATEKYRAEHTAQLSVAQLMEQTILKVSAKKEF